LGAAFDFINRLGIRYERAIQNLALLNQYYLTISANRIAKLGEGVLFVVLVPYYGTHLLKDIRGDHGFDRYGYLIFFISGIIGVWKYFEVTEEIESFRHGRSSWKDFAGVLSRVAAGLAAVLIAMEVVSVLPSLKPADDASDLFGLVREGATKWWNQLKTILCPGP
jgi:hypothetical protein